MSWDTPYCCIHLPALYVLYTETFSRLLGPPEKGMALGAEQSFFPSSYPCLNLASVLPESSDANARDSIVAAPTTALIAASAAAAATYLDAKFHISKDIRTISLNWGAERHYARAGTLLPVKCSEREPRSIALRNWCATSQIQSTLNLLFL